jgi:hypothetical protein
MTGLTDSARLKIHRPLCKILLFAAIVLAIPSITHAEKLPVRYYTTDDGLAYNRVMRIVRDSQGFLWFCTPEGLNRFDGQRFTVFRLADELRATFNDFLETRTGEYWAATNGGGVCRLNRSPHSPAPELETRAMFTLYPLSGPGPSNFVNTLY